jgi:hypothetical protein
MPIAEFSHIRIYGNDCCPFLNFARLSLYSGQASIARRAALRDDRAAHLRRCPAATPALFIALAISPNRIGNFVTTIGPLLQPSD